MNEFAQTLSDLATLCGKSKYQLAQLSGLDPTFVRRLFDGEKRASNQTIIRLTIALAIPLTRPVTAISVARRWT